jgi:hypothetical protein
MAKGARMDFDQIFKTPQIDFPRDRIFKVGDVEIMFPSARYTPPPTNWLSPTWKEDGEADYQQWAAAIWKKAKRRQPGHTMSEYVADKLRRIFPGDLPPRAVIERKLRDPKNPDKFLLPGNPEISFGLRALKDAIKLARARS